MSENISVQYTFDVNSTTWARLPTKHHIDLELLTLKNYKCIYLANMNFLV